MNNHNADDGSRERLLGRITALLWVVVIALAVTFFYFASSFWITLASVGFLSDSRRAACCAHRETARSPLCGRYAGYRPWRASGERNPLRLLQ